jgi:hypothetical protein
LHIVLFHVKQHMVARKGEVTRFSIHYVRHLQPFLAGRYKLTMGNLMKVRRASLSRSFKRKWDLENADQKDISPAHSLEP